MAASKQHNLVGSYDARKFPQKEIDRLVRQGSATWQQEREILLWGGLKRGANVLDLGCGPGVISSLLAKEVGFTEVRSQVLLISPDEVGKGAFLDSVLTWRPQLYPEDLRTEAGERITLMRTFCEESMVEGYNGAFVVFGTKPEI